MQIGELGRVYGDREPIMQQGERGDCMYVVQSGTAEVVLAQGDGETRVALLKAGDVFGEMALFTGETRSATVRAVDSARIMTIDRRGFLRRVHEDPSLAFRVLKNMAERVGQLDREVVRLHQLLQGTAAAGEPDPPRR